MGELSAREGLVGQIPGLRRYARMLVGDAARADDLVQDCLSRALSRLHLWQGGNLRAWLFTILHNLHVNHRRHAARMPPTASIDAVLPPGLDADQDRRLEARQILERLADLPADQREVVLLVAVEGLSYEEIAQVQDVPIGTVMSRLSRARAQLRQAATGHPVLKRVK